MSGTISLTTMTRYPVHEHFYTWQGEGLHAGRAAYFIRLQGCDQRCGFCDAAGTWHPDYRPRHVPLLSPEETADLVQAPRGAFVVLTGGEPTLYNLEPLIHELHLRGYQVHLETAGHHDLPRGIDWVTMSPKPFAKQPLPENVRLTDEFKIIVTGIDSIAEGLGCISDRDASAPVWLVPEWSRRGDLEVLNLISDMVKQNPQLRAGWQLHKNYGVDALDENSRPAVPLGGNPARGASA